MTFLVPTLLLLTGGALLYFGGEGLVRGASSIATRHGVSRLVVGLTVVAFGTSAPELFVSLMAAARGSADIALGNVVGSNIANVGLVLGTAALIAPLTVQHSTIKYEIPFAALAAASLWALALNLRLGVVEGVTLLFLFALFLYYCFRSARLPKCEDECSEKPLPSGFHDWTYTLVGLAALVVGSEFFVRGAVSAARAIGVSEFFIGLSVVAVGTSLPEAAATLVAAMRRESDLAVGGVVGSNIFNILLILGLTPLVRPLTCPESSLRVDLPLVFLIHILLLPFCWSRRLGRTGGAFFLALYAAYIAYAAVRG